MGDRHKQMSSRHALSPSSAMDTVAVLGSPMTKEEMEETASLTRKTSLSS